MSTSLRLSTGIERLDSILGGGLLPGMLTVVVGASGIGKTQLGLHFAATGQQREGKHGIVFDMNARADSQGHLEYARRLCGWQLDVANPGCLPNLADFFAANHSRGDYLHIFDRSGRRVTQHDLDFDGWHNWQAELSAKLQRTIAFFYGNFIDGVRRVVVDGLEPVDRKSQSIQFELFEYIYHQILRKESEWVARDLFRQHYRESAEIVAAHQYDHRQIGCMLLYTAHEVMLEDLISRPLEDSDLLASANTVIYMGKLREANRLGRGLYVAKHRGSACSDELVRFSIADGGIRVE